MNMETAVGRCDLPEGVDSKWEFDCSAATQRVSGLEAPGALIPGLRTCLGHCNCRKQDQGLNEALGFEKSKWKGLKRHANV